MCLARSLACDTAIHRQCQRCDRVTTRCLLIQQLRMSRQPGLPQAWKDHPDISAEIVRGASVYWHEFDAFRNNRRARISFDRPPKVCAAAGLANVPSAANPFPTDDSLPVPARSP